jgi:hypothetical protein
MQVEYIRVFDVAQMEAKYKRNVPIQSPFRQFPWFILYSCHQTCFAGIMHWVVGPDSGSIPWDWPLQCRCNTRFWTSMTRDTHQCLLLDNLHKHSLCLRVHMPRRLLGAYTGLVRRMSDSFEPWCARERSARCNVHFANNGKPTCTYDIRWTVAGLHVWYSVLAGSIGRHMCHIKILPMCPPIGL